MLLVAMIKPFFLLYLPVKTLSHSAYYKDQIPLTGYTIMNTTLKDVLYYYYYYYILSLTFTDCMNVHTYYGLLYPLTIEENMTT